MTDPADVPSTAAGAPQIDRRRLVAVGVLVALAGATVVMALRHSPVPVPGVDAPASSGVAPAPRAVAAAEAGSVTVHVAGAVLHPGLVTVRSDARVADAIAAAGGATGGADLGSVNLAAPVADGAQLVVPLAGAPGASGVAETERGGSVDLNRADVEDLMRLDGVGEVLARRIVAYRDTNGPFATVEDLLDVAGIGEGKLAAIREGATVR